MAKQNPLPAKDPAEEISLRDLACILRRTWRLTFLLVCLAVLLATAYIYFVPPVYEVSVQVLPPTTGDLAIYNATQGILADKPADARILREQMGDEIRNTLLQPDEAWNRFLAVLQSGSVKQQFITEYHPAGAARDATPLTLRRMLDRNLTVTVNKGGALASARVTLRGTQPDVLSERTIQYARLALALGRDMLLEDLKSQLRVQNDVIDKRIAALREIGRYQRDARMVRLRDAITVARAIGLAKAPENSPLIVVGDDRAGASRHADGLLYMRGYEALQSELTQLQQRQNDDAYISGMLPLIEKQTRLAHVDIDDMRLSIGRIDAASDVYVHKVAPRAMLILALSVLASLVLGCAVSVACHMLAMTDSRRS
ncbi:Wzz/FepE/Etk N-terminal domain-containing protein [Allopusillimonas soli]|uniref:Polysaccharide chain length determinant N-terminal domain-containing protein n=1 Tax=Allopusillimonas soli TaxID=659016 RepID=A0A853FD28_9BURK|nr:Wzz/FepE/Etk N-terminal domain-containing protein [Allopusillimonas soli]NYT37552.1 hypothetical protein [Allopusillimonas soli]